LKSIYVLAQSIVTALGDTAESTISGLKNQVSGIRYESDVLDEVPCPVGNISSPLHPLPENVAQFSNRCCRIAINTIRSLDSEIESLKNRYPAHRLGIVCGTSASGTEATEAHWKPDGNFPFDYHNLHTFWSVARCIQAYTGFKGPAYTVSTACSSAANAMISSMHLIRSGMCDAVLTGGVDSLCKTTYHGFRSLQIMDHEACRPFDLNRKGLTLGEGAAFFVLGGEKASNDVYCPRIVGAGSSSSAYHMTAPDPDGSGAILSMISALDSAGLQPSDIDYINLHGTGTPLNDVSEASAVLEVFGSHLPCSSTKGYTGHLLGASAAIESAICMLAMQHGFIPGNLNLETLDPDVKISIVQNTESTMSLKHVLSNSFAFGGNNTSLIFGV
jgi:3-oxoacyl-[acyl-carrier-protein] synthase I